MNSPMIFKLIIKDWHLFKRYILGYTLLGFFAALLMSWPSYLAYYSGQVLLITVLIGASAHITISSVVTEKKEYQLSFLMALPINVMDYTLAKLLGGLAIYFIMWSAVLGLTVMVIIFSALPNGLIPMVVICATEILTATSLLLMVGILSGSEAFTIITMVILNIFFNLFIFAVFSVADISAHVQAASPVFNQTVFTFMGAELAIIVLAVSLTTFIKSRQTCFL